MAAPLASAHGKRRGLPTAARQPLAECFTDYLRPFAAQLWSLQAVRSLSVGPQ
jgi:hypothetical protein